MPRLTDREMLERCRAVLANILAQFKPHGVCNEVDLGDYNIHLIESHELNSALDAARALLRELGERREPADGRWSLHCACCHASDWADDGAHITCRRCSGSVLKRDLRAEDWEARDV